MEFYVLGSAQNPDKVATKKSKLWTFKQTCDKTILLVTSGETKHRTKFFTVLEKLHEAGYKGRREKSSNFFSEGNNLVEAWNYLKGTKPNEKKIKTV